MLRWGLVGAGRAGRARARAIDADPRATLVGWHRGHLDHPTAASFSSLVQLAEQVDVVAICSPNGVHEDQVRQALESSCHVLCEFPLALSGARARALLDQARTLQRLVHVEHIELLTPAAIWMRQRVQDRTLVRGRLQSMRGGGGWLDDPEQAGPLPHRHVASLHRLLDLLGVPTAAVVTSRNPQQVQAVLVFDQVRVDLQFRQSPGLARGNKLELTLSDGSVHWSGQGVVEDGRPIELPPSSSLFLADQLLASAVFLDGADPPVSEDRIIQVLELADRLQNDPITC